MAWSDNSWLSGEPSTAMSELLRRKLVSPMPVIPAVTEITTATITGVMGTTLAGVNATTPTGGSQRPLLAGRVLRWPILRQRILPLQRALLYRASDSFLFSRL